MAKITIETRYGTVPNSLLNNKEVTFKAKGIFAYIQSKPDDWDFSAERIAGQTKEGLGAVKSGLRELEKSGHLIRRRVNNNKGFFEVEYILIAEPSSEPMVKNPPVDKPTVGNHTNNSNKVNSKKEISNNIPAEENKDDISLLTSDTAMYESKKTNIELNCTLPINDVTIHITEPKKKSKSNFQSNPDKYTWINARVKEFNEGLPKERQFTRPNKSGKTREEKAGNTHLLGVVYEKFGEEKATEFFNYIVAKGEWRNPYSISSLKNQEEFENFYQDPQEEQPKYLGTKIGDAVARFKNYQEEPIVGVFVNEEYFYAALEQFYSNQFDGTELVKKVRERVKEINCKYNKY